MFVKLGFLKNTEKKIYQHLKGKYSGKFVDHLKKYITPGGSEETMNYIILLLIKYC
jgi:hypothetical protein